MLKYVGFLFTWHDFSGVGYPVKSVFTA